MPDGVLTVARLIWSPVRWALRRVRRYTADREALRREGSALVTPIIQFTKELGPSSILFGADEDNEMRLKRKATSGPDSGTHHDVCQPPSL